RRATRRLPVRARLPVLRPEPEVRQPERVPRQGRSPHTSDEDVEFRLARSSYSRQSTKEATMQYMLLIYNPPGDWESMPAEQRQAISHEYFTFTEELKASGKLVGGDALQPISTATSVQIRD